MVALDDSQATSTTQPEEQVVSGGQGAGATRGRTRDVRARARVTAASAGDRVRNGWDTTTELTVHHAAKVRTRISSNDLSDGIYRGHPASIQELVAYTRDGDWVPGDQHQVLEALGRAYGYLIAIPVSFLLYGACWALQRPLRFVTAISLVAALYLILG
jgi:hypothetical protein